jgi:hypothetical protein
MLRCPVTGTHGTRETHHQEIKTLYVLPLAEPGGLPGLTWDRPKRGRLGQAPSVAELKLQDALDLDGPVEPLPGGDA